MEKKSRRDISNLMLLFNLISKFFGFATVQPNLPFIDRWIRESSLFMYLLLSTGCSIRSELWCIFVLQVDFTERKFIIFMITQVVVGSTFICLFSHRLNNSKIWNIIAKVQFLEESLILYNVKLEAVKIGFYGLIFSFMHLFLILSMMYYMVFQYPIVLLVDSTCVFYFEAWVAVPCLQFVGWISLLSYVLYRIQCRIIQLYSYELDWTIRPWNDLGLKRRQSMRLNQLSDNNLLKIKRFVAILKEVINIATETANAYGIMILIYMLNYLSRVIAQFYDLIDKNSHRFSIGIGIWNIVIRMMFILPIFVCCENFTFNVNRTVQVIQKMTVLHHPSSLNIVFQCLTLRLRHKTPTVKVCGILNITYRSFLTIITTSVAFLVLQLQST